MTGEERDFIDYLQDILDNANKLKAFLGGHSFATFEKDEKTQYAIVRALELIRKEAEAGTLHSRKLRSFTEPAFR